MITCKYECRKNLKTKQKKCCNLRFLNIKYVMHHRRIKQINFFEKRSHNAAFILIIIAALIAFHLITYSYSVRQFFKRQAYSHVQQNTQTIKNLVDLKIREGFSSIRFTSFIIPRSILEKTLVNDTRILNSFLVNTPFSFLQFIDSDGNNNMNEVPNSEPVFEGNQDYFIEGIKGKSGLFENFHSTSSKGVILDFYSPIYYNNQIAGVLVGGINSEEVLKPFLTSDFYGKETIGILCDSDFNVITSNYPPLQYGSDLKNLEMNQALELFLEHAKNGDEKVFSFKHQNKREIACIAKLKNADWFLIQILTDDVKVALDAKSIIFIVFQILAFAIIIIFYIIQVVQIRHSTERMHLNVISALCSSYQNVYVVNIKTGKFFIYQLTDRMKKSYEKRFLASDYDKCFKIYEENEVYPEDRELFAKVNEIGKIRKILKSQNEYSFVYRIKSKTSGEKIHFFQCYFIRPQSSKEFVVTFKNVDELIETRETIDTLMKEQTIHFQIISSISKIYLSLHFIDIDTNSFIDLNATKDPKNYVASTEHAYEQIQNVIKSFCYEEYINAAIEFANLATLKERLKDKKYISIELNSKRIGWIRANFISVTNDENGLPMQVIFATQSINNEKRREEILISNANTDELTKLLNRHAYEEYLHELEKAENENKLSDNFAYISLDLNGLKNANDTFGHASGDELLCGVADCLKDAFGEYGKIFRTGGDEFQIIIFVSPEQLKIAKEKFDKNCSDWKGENSKSLSVSYGIVTKRENPEQKISSIIKLADKKMYKAKSEYYSTKGVDRRGTRDAMRILSQSYIKILKINLSKDAFSVIQILDDETDSVKNFDGIASKWFLSFANSDFIDKRDRKEFLDKTNFEFMKNYFSDEKRNLLIHYKRKIHGKFKNVQMEIIKSPEYCEQNEIVYLFVHEE